MCVCAGAPPSGAQTPAAKYDAELGERIYREGVLPGGAPLRATVQGDVEVEGTQFNCATCHRRSGFGSSEGAAFVPPVTGSFLYREKEPRGAELFRRLFQEVQPRRSRARVRDPRTRPAYTDETLAAALNGGVDPTGRELDALMPRYRLSKDDAGHLIAYLKSLSSAPAPGVSHSAIHFATVVTEGVEPEKRRAMSDVMDAYLRWKNADTARMIRRPVRADSYQEDLYGTYREWVLHVWELKGPAESWPAQLDAHYREQPVFALLGGIGESEWQPVHDFCERREVPCLFPQTNQPVVSRAGAFTLYLTKGLTVEAEALARYLEDDAGAVGATRIVQVYRDTGGGLVLARALGRKLRARGSSGLRERVIRGTQKLTPAFWKNLIEVERPSSLVLWLDGADLGMMDSAQTAAGTVRRIYLSYGLLEGMPPRSFKSLRDKVYVTYPYSLPRDESPHVYRVRAWLRSRGVERLHERTQLNTYFVLTVADHSLMRLAGNFSRDYFVENVEQETESALNPGVFPRLSLGPDQRFASKGSYIVKLSDSAQGGLEPVSSWIIP
ncbi:MAG: ABC transporter substrate-binding protein [Acidobacteria bacterium]|nr:ABC transporter substrate-binding protein [Acidobacteriota bacterium]